MAWRTKEYQLRASRIANGTCRARRAKLSELPVVEGRLVMACRLVQRHGGLQDCIEAFEINRLRQILAAARVNCRLPKRVGIMA